MRWIFLLTGVASVAVLYGVGPQLALPAAFAVLFVNFATFCLQYDEPLNRARGRVAATLGRMSTGGAHTDEYQRLQSSAPVITAEDRKRRFGLMTITGIASGFVSLCLLAWGIALRFF